MRCKSQKLRRYSQRISSLIDDMKEKKLIDDDAFKRLSKYGGLTFGLFKNECKNRDRKQGRRYDSEVVRFSLALHFYSPSAYRLFRKILTLPHESRIREWIGNVDFEPGFLNQAFEYLSYNYNITSSVQHCSLLMDEMCIRRSSDYEATR